MRTDSIYKVCNRVEHGGNFRTFMTNKQLLTLLDSKCACADARDQRRDAARRRRGVRSRRRGDVLSRAPHLCLIATNSESSERLLIYLPPNLNVR